MPARKKAPLRPASAPAGVDRFDWEVVTFVLHWAPYGGADDADVVPTFGMPYRRLEKRFAAIVNDLALRTVGGEVRLDRQQREVLRRAVKLLPEASGPPPMDSTVALSPTAGEWVVRRGLRHWRPRPARGVDAPAGSD